MLELAAIVILGIIAQWISWRMSLPAILPLIIIGLLAGPIASLDFLLDYKLIDPDRIFEGNMLNYFVSLSVGVILFEGGLTLKLKEVRHVATTVRNLLIIGPVVSLIGGGLLAFYLLDLDIRIALLFGALVIVTGPTVIGPILRNVHPDKKIATILHWESIIIDPIGALVAVLMYEFILSGAVGAELTLQAILTFGKIILAGIMTGIFSAWALYTLLKRNLVPQYLTNVVSLALVFVAFVGADLISSEAGLLAVTIMGMVLANLRIPELSTILNFKESLTVLLISILFIILSANIDIVQMQKLGWSSLLVLAGVIFILRPLAVLLSAIGSNLNWREKLFISWIGPRGIVAAAIASLFAISIMDKRPGLFPDAEYLIPLTFLIILGTVILQGLTAKPLANWLGVTRKDSSGILMLGAHEAARIIAKYLQDNETPVMLVDTSHTNLNEAKVMGLKVIERNVLSDDIAEEFELADLGMFMALTSNNELNIFACRKFKKEFGSNTTFRLITRNEMKFTSLVRPKYILFGNNADFYKLIEISRNYPEIKELQLGSEQHAKKVLGELPEEVVPLFLKTKESNIKIIPADHNIEYEEGDILVYMGQRMDEVHNF